MTKEDALIRVSALMAMNRFDHEQAAKETPSLRQNTADNREKLLAMAVALGIEEKYRADCSTMNVDP